jgi:hypothetical protein
MSTFFFSNSVESEARSLRFDRGADAELTRTPSSNGDSVNFSFSCWIKRGKLSDTSIQDFTLLSAYSSISNNTEFYIDSSYGHLQFEVTGSGSTQVNLSTAMELRDPAAWYHILLTMKSGFQGATKIYVNNELAAQTSDTGGGRLNKSSPHGIGAQMGNLGGSAHFDGLMAEVYMIDGQTKLPTDFGEYDSNGLWVPKAYSGGYGTNGFHLNFSNNSSTSNLGKDYSGNGNNWTVTNFSVTTGSGDDSFIDIPTNNFATLNPLDESPSGVDNGNLDATSANAYPTIIPGSGTWYYEVNGTGYTWNGTRSGWTKRSGSHNFGQRTFNGTATADTLCAANLPTPVIADPSEHMDIATYTGNQSSRNITGINHSPDVVWIKQRGSEAVAHRLTNTLRGTGKYLAPNNGGQEGTDTNGVTSFNSNGFSLGNNNFYNRSGRAYVAWCWNVAEGNSSNNVGTINNTLRINYTADFALIQYEGNGTAGATVGHGLGAEPEFIIVKNLDRSVHWQVYHKQLGNNKRFRMSAGGAANTGSQFWNSTTPTNTVFTLGANNGVNANGETHLAMCWAGIEGYSKFDTYTGNGSTDGPFVNLNFRPKWIMIKADASINWNMFDADRDGHNPDNNRLITNTSAIENTDDYLDLLSNGFKIRSTNSGVNQTSTNYYYAAFAEMPFVYANAR